MNNTIEQKLKKALDRSPILLGVLLTLIGFTFLIFVPFCFIWAMNTLFNLSIAYSLLNWLASGLILILVNLNRS